MDKIALLKFAFSPSEPPTFEDLADNYTIRAGLPILGGALGFMLGIPVAKQLAKMFAGRAANKAMIQIAKGQGLNIADPEIANTINHQGPVFAKMVREAISGNMQEVNAISKQLEQNKIAPEFVQEALLRTEKNLAPVSNAAKLTLMAGGIGGSSLVPYAERKIYPEGSPIQAKDEAVFALKLHKAREMGLDPTNQETLSGIISGRIPVKV